MTNSLGVQSGALESAAASFAEHVAQYESVKSRLQSEVEATESSWEGSAGDAFRQAADQWQDASAQTVQALTEIQEKLQTAGVKFAQKESENTTGLKQAQLNW
ncbi:WXG100 family type VII secretion target [Segniliparus rugosus]|uniref:ESAT-6-like protein n=1 Tax=Segniliparus rugosus (strain ATCC BAA-974 / DSM 45345 / CCUG 50838 / CIP 108380 / JCM 13579 / CDC 945) TaxID=679197 RepID=E5XKS0_SEGRC|nr:WXG100 family type VII secretion target [Segniliparus rugosus]EFV15063.1 WXG100 family type VII secretion target [Segniliparus rugosus ATCC BAA-974]